jgi:hypothetical protein
VNARPNRLSPIGLAHRQIWAKPPSAKTSLAVIKLLSSEARKATTFATSSSVPVRASGVMLAAYSIKLASASLSTSVFSCPGVGITPGLTALTRMFLPRRSDDHVRANERTAAFVTL